MLLRAQYLLVILVAVVVLVVKSCQLSVFKFRSQGVAGNVRLLQLRS